MEEENKKIKRAKGGGRKKTQGKPISFRPDIDLEEMLCEMKKRTSFINECIRFYILNNK